MTIKELKEIINKMPDDFQVIMSSDSEGNNYSPLCDVDTIQYREESQWNGYILCEEEMDGEDFEINAVCFWPIN